MMRRTDGFSGWVFAIFLMVTFVLAGEAWMDYAAVQATRNQLTQLLTLGLQGAIAQGATVEPDGTVTWNATAAQTGATTTMTQLWSIAVASEQFQNPGSATFTRTGSAVPADWVRPLQLVQFQTSDTGGTVTVGNQTETVDHAYVAAALELPIRLTFMAIPLTYTVDVARVDQVAGYNGQQFRLR